jgi:DNA-binding NarL/FixJ family response regulator
MNLPRKSISVILADDHEIFRRGVRNIISGHAHWNIDLLDEACNGAELVEKVRGYHPDIVLTDIKMPVMNGIEACKLIKHHCPATKTIALSLFEEIDYVVEMVNAGASGYLVKTTTSDELIKAITTVSAGIPYYCSTATQKLLAVPVNNQLSKLPKKILLTKHELSVTRLLCQQFTSKEIASKVGLAIRTVEDYRRNIQQKMGVKNNVGVALYAMFHEIVKWTEI